MRFLALILLGSALLVAGSAGAGGGPTIIGDWSRNDGSSRINIGPCGQLLCAVNTWIRDPADGELVGDRLVLALQPRDPDALTGEAFDERRKLRYSLLISVKGNAMTTEGCLVSGVLCKSLRWIRVH
jgi:uncharacterized protein (DUF2147 family)